MYNIGTRGNSNNGNIRIYILMWPRWIFYSGVNGRGYWIIGRRYHDSYRCVWFDRTSTALSITADEFLWNNVYIMCLINNNNTYDIIIHYCVARCSAHSQKKLMTIIIVLFRILGEPCSVELWYYNIGTCHVPFGTWIQTSKRGERQIWYLSKNLLVLNVTLIYRYFINS